MTHANPNTTKDGLAWRYATQVFDTNKKIPPEDLHYILECGNLAATSYGLQPFTCVVIDDQATKDALVEHSWGQEHVAKNSHLIVLSARTDITEETIGEYTERIEKTRALPPGAMNGFKNAMIGDLMSRSALERLVWAQKQAYIALGTMMVAASERRIDNHGLEGFQPAKYNEILGLTDRHLHATVLLALGYRAPTDTWQEYKKVRRPIGEMVVRI